MKSLLMRGTAGLACLSLTACSALGSSEDRLSELVVAMTGDVSSFDPATGNSGNDHVFLYPVFDTLIGFDPETTEPVPGLAEEWTYEDPRTLVLTLREGVTFHDGTEFDAEAVQANLDRSRSEGSNLQSELSSVDTVTAVDARTVRIELSEPDSALPLILSDRAGMMVSPAALEDPETLASAPVGTGPWELREWKRGSAVEYTANDDYWNEDVHASPRMTYRVLSDPKTRVDALITNQVDIAYQVGAADAESLALNNEITVNADPSMRVRMIYLDLSDELMAKREVRQALNLAIDREQMAEVGFFGYAEPASTYLPESHWASVEAESQYDYDPERARELLREAGAEGASVSVLLPNDANTVRLAEIIRYSYEDIGLDVTMKPRELVQSTTEYFDENREHALFSSWTGRPDPAQTYAQLLDEAGYYNTGGVPTPGLQEAVDRSNEKTTEDTRATDLKEAGRLTFEFATFVPLVFEDTLVAHAGHVRGYQPNLLGKPKFTDVTETR
ncbi:ABC transporter substrate-binding protein [Brevibacterium album]|uniref:ABC transporter substrate-binding protein n=1 Tax=Brevibacterium album TaxID=417948 RepID=UPI00040072F2|nr:ABC transporter substrate-binding protein [Brevibacterium album]